MNIKQTLHYKVAINIIGETFIFHVLLPISPPDKVLQWQLFHIWGTKNVVASHLRQVVVLCSNSSMGIGLGGLGISRLKLVVVL